MPKVFQNYAALKYTGSVASRGSLDDRRSLVDVYVLAESFVDAWAKNRIIDAMHNFLRESVPMGSGGIQSQKEWNQAQISPDSLTTLYEGTTEGSLTRKLLVDFHANKYCKDHLITGGDKLPADFVHELAVHMDFTPPIGCFPHQQVLSRLSSDDHEPLGKKSGTGLFSAKQ